MIQKRNIFIAGLFSLEAASRRIPLTYSAPHPEEEEKCGVLHKLKSCDSDIDDLWELRRVVLSDKLLCFTPLESFRTVSDCIPIHEISQVFTSECWDPMLNHLLTTHLPLHFSVPSAAPARRDTAAGAAVAAAITVVSSAARRRLVPVPLLVLVLLCL